MNQNQVEWTGASIGQEMRTNLVLPKVALAQGTMLEALERIEKCLPGLLSDETQWKSLDINYHPPRVERMWMQLDGLRVSLHRIHPCSREDALFHPHPWPSAMRVIKGGYEMALGYGRGESMPPIAATLSMNTGTKYEMVDPDSWHYVRPISGPAVTLMITGRPWERSVPKSKEALNPLREDERRCLLQEFRDYYSA